MAAQVVVEVVSHRVKGGQFRRPEGFDHLLAVHPLHVLKDFPSSRDNMLAGTSLDHRDGGGRTLLQVFIRLVHPVKQADSMEVVINFGHLRDNEQGPRFGVEHVSVDVELALLARGHLWLGRSATHFVFFCLINYYNYDISIKPTN